MPETVRSVGSLLIVLALLGTALPWLAASASASSDCQLHRSGTLRIGVLGTVRIGDWSHASEPVPSECQGSAFTVSATGAGADLDVCWYTEFDTQLRCHRAGAEPTGFIPDNAAEAKIVLQTGRNVTYTFEASPTATGTTCDLQRSGSLEVGTLAAASVAGSSKTSVPVPKPCRGGPFLLSGSGTGVDLDVCWYDSDGFERRCHNSASPVERGFIHPSATEARITLHQGANASYTLEAPAGPVGGEPRTITKTYAGFSVTGLWVGYNHKYQAPSWTDIPVASEDDTVRVVLDDGVIEEAAAEVEFEGPSQNLDIVAVCGDSGELQIPDGTIRVEVFLARPEEAQQTCGPGATGSTTGTMSIHLNGGSG